MIYELLDTGKENALSTEYLKQALGFRDVRSLRKQVETERLNGKIKEFVRNLESTADSMNKIADLAKAYYTRGVDNAEL